MDDIPIIPEETTGSLIVDQSYDHEPDIKQLMSPLVFMGDTGTVCILEPRGRWYGFRLPLKNEKCKDSRGP